MHTYKQTDKQKGKQRDNQHTDIKKIDRKKYRLTARKKQSYIN